MPLAVDSRRVKFVIISPVRNEASHLAKTIVSISGQTILPSQWIVVDDGSTDNSRVILSAAASQFDWITLISRADRGARKPGTGVIEAFYDGYALISKPWDFLVKLDGDVSFESNYFQRCFQKFSENSKLGIGGGTVCNLRDGKLVQESTIDPAFHVRGATKIYRRECWHQIGELIRAPGWDTLDELKANMLGWSTATFPDIKLIHHKPAGSADGSWKNWVKNGFSNYLVGYHPLFMLLKSVRRLAYRPYGIQSVGLMYGFLKGYFRRAPQLPERQLIAYIRDQQLRRMTWRSSLWR
jgi:biofilm PGA synthesis N-glycosyltransferase PgaC